MRVTHSAVQVGCMAFGGMAIATAAYVAMVDHTRTLGDAIGERSGVAVRIGRVDIVPWGAVRLADVNIADVGTIEAVDLRANFDELLRGRVVPAMVRIERPALSFVEIPRRAPSGTRAGALPPTRHRRSASVGSLREIELEVVDGAIDLARRNVAISVRGLHASGTLDAMRIVARSTSLRAAAEGVTLSVDFGVAAADVSPSERRLVRVIGMSGRGAVTSPAGATPLQDLAFAYGVVPGHSSMVGRAGKGEFRVDLGPQDFKAHWNNVDLGALYHPVGLRGSDGARSTGNVTATRSGDITFGVSADGIELDNRALADSAMQVEGWIRGTVRYAANTLSGQVAVHTGALDVALSGDVHTTKGRPHRGRVEATFGETTCADALASIPKGLLPNLAALDLRGTFKGAATLTFDRDDPAASKLAMDFPFRRCRHGGEYELPLPASPGGEAIALGDIPRIAAAFVGAEDGTFYKHRGFNWKQIAKAVSVNLAQRRFARGGSTISQQLVKNLFLSHDKHLSRKLEETLLTWLVESRWSKREILARYVNLIELGEGVHGIAAASQHWFSKPAPDLSPVEAAFIASLAPAPVATERRIRRACAAPGTPCAPDSVQRDRIGKILESMHAVAPDLLSKTDLRAYAPGSIVLQLAER